MSQFIIGQRYARALYSLANQQGILDEIYENVSLLNGLVTSNKQLHEFINNPLFSIEEREQILHRVLGAVLHPLTKKTIDFMNYKGRLHCLDEMLKAFDIMYLNDKKRVRAEIYAAQPLDESMKQRIIAFLERRFAKQVMPFWHVKESLLGGFRIVVDGYLFDYSFDDQLNRFINNVDQVRLDFNQ